MQSRDREETKERMEKDIMQGGNTIDGGGRGKGVTDRQTIGTINNTCIQRDEIDTPTTRRIHKVKRKRL